MNYIVGTSHKCFGPASVSMRIRIQHFRSMRIRIQIQGFDDPKICNIYSWNFFKYILLIKNCYLFIPRPHKGRLSYRRSLQPSKENIQNLKTWNFLTNFYVRGSFLPSWIRIRILRKLLGTLNCTIITLFIHIPVFVVHCVTDLQYWFSARNIYKL